MNTVNEKIILELISYINTRKIGDTDVYIRKPVKKLGDVSFVVRAGNLLTWIDPRLHFKETNKEKYEILEDFMDPEDFAEAYSEYALLFKHMPELNDILNLKDNYIEFNSSLSSDDIQEIYQFVEMNYLVNQANISTYIRSSK